MLVRCSFRFNLNEEREELLKSSSFEFHFIGPWKRILNFPKRDTEVVGWDMSIPLKLFLVLDGNGSLFPRTSARYFSPVDQGILKGRSAWKYVLSVEAPKESQPFFLSQSLWNKNAGWMKKYQSLSHENLNQRKKRWQQERIYLLSFVYKQYEEKKRSK